MPATAWIALAVVLVPAVALFVFTGIRAHRRTTPLDTSHEDPRIVSARYRVVQVIGGAPPAVFFAVLLLFHGDLELAVFWGLVALAIALTLAIVVTIVAVWLQHHHAET